MKNIKTLLFIALLCLFACSCVAADSETLNHNVAVTPDNGMEDTSLKNQNLFNKSLEERQIEIFSRVVTFELLEGIVGELTYDYTPILSSYSTEVYKCEDGYKYELEFVPTLDGTREVVACRRYIGDDSEWMFCKTKSTLYYDHKMQEGDTWWVLH